jgi:hypothetical protein
MSHVQALYAKDKKRVTRNFPRNPEKNSWYGIVVCQVNSGLIALRTDSNSALGIVGRAVGSH